MGKEKVGDDRAYYEGSDKPFYEQSGGRLVPTPGFGSDDGFGTPVSPGVRGEAYGGSHSHDRSMGGRNGMIDKFISRKKGK